MHFYNCSLLLATSATTLHIRECESLRLRLNPLHNYKLWRGCGALVGMACGARRLSLGILGSESSVYMELQVRIPGFEFHFGDQMRHGRRSGIVNQLSRTKEKGLPLAGFEPRYSDLELQ